MDFCGSSDSGGVRGEGQLLQSIVAHWIHEDQLYWMQVRHLFAIQLFLATVVGAAAANYATRVGDAVPCRFWLVLFFTGALALIAAAGSAALARLATTIRCNRDVNAFLIGPLSRHLATKEFVDELEKAHSGVRVYKEELLRLAEHELKGSKYAGRVFQRNVFTFCICIDAIVGAAALVLILLVPGACNLPRETGQTCLNGTLSLLPDQRLHCQLLLH